MARPTMRTGELGAAAHKIDPISKMTNMIMNIHLTLNSAYSFPIMSWKAQPVSKYDEPYQPTSDNELKSLVIFGIAVAMIDRS